MSERPDFERMSVDKRSSMTAQMIWELHEELPSIKTRVESLENFRAWVWGALAVISLAITGMITWGPTLFAKKP